MCEINSPQSVYNIKDSSHSVQSSNNYSANPTHSQYCPAPPTIRPAALSEKHLKKCYKFPFAHIFFLIFSQLPLKTKSELSVYWDS